MAHTLMEVFLLLLDEIDDAVAVLWSLLPRMLAVFATGALLVGTGFAFLRLPELAIPSATLLIGAALLYRVQPYPKPDSLLRDR